MKKLMTFLVLVIISGQLTAQNAVWYFGNRGGLTFNSCTTSPSSGTIAIQTTEGCTIVSDQANHVLFYSDGVNVYDESGNLLSNSLLGGISSTQAALAVPIPSSTGSPRFLIFTTVGVEENKPRDLAVALVTTASSTYPYGVSVSTPASYIYPYSSTVYFWAEKLACTSDGHNGYWVFAHNYHSDTSRANTFYKFHLDYNDPAYAGITTGAQAASWLYSIVATQDIGMSHDSLPNNAKGQMKFSLKNDKLGLVLGGADTWEVYNFNQTTGVLSNRITNAITSTDHGYYGCEFSPDGNYFYTTDAFSQNYKSLCQWNLNSPALPTVIATNTLSSHDNSLQLERECGKIYCAEFNDGVLGVIANPNVGGSGCNYSDANVPISGISKAGLPSYYILGSQAPGVLPCECKTSIGPISVPVKSNGEGTVDITLNSGDLIPNYIRIDWANFEVTTNSEDCRKYCCGMTTENMGMLVPKLPSITNFSTALTPWSAGSQADFSREMVFTFQGDNAKPINNVVVHLNLKFPFISDLTCCEVHYFGSFMVTYVDKDCHMCQSLIFAQSDTIDKSKVDLKKQSTLVTPVAPILNTKETAPHTFKVYPNPNDGTFTISTSNLGNNLPYEVMDEHGSLVSSGTLNGAQGKINISNLSPGIYYVRVVSGSNRYTEKVVLQK